MFFNAINPISKEKIATFEISIDKQIEIYEVFMLALDYNPSTEEFAKRIMKLKYILNCDDEILEKWITSLQKITTKNENPNHMCFILEDWIDEWYIADFIDQRFLVITFEQ
jgi:hypothetical protein